MNEIPEQEREQLAVIGMSGRFPGASSVQELWAKLRSGTECITFFSREQLERAGVPAEQLEDPAYVPARGVLTEIEGFDAGLFGLTPNEAAVMDPQQRLFLECAWEAMEDAGYPTEPAGQRAGIFAGSAEGLYRFYNVMAAGGELAARVGAMAAGLLNDRDLLPMQVSYRLGLTGPSVSVQSACSTSLLAVHLAGQALLSGECDLALAGGVALNLPQETGYLYEEGGILSPDGHCRPFDARAQGTLSGSGVGVVVLKRLSDALADGDGIRAVILGTATGNDGSERVGFTAPGVEGQMVTVAEALEVAGVDPRTIGYVETHGSATPLGDPIEVSALSGAFQATSSEPRSQERGWCAIGSVKSNLGHLDEAAGVAGLIKTILALEHGEIPPSLNFAEANPQIDFASSPFYVNTELRPWPAGPRPTEESARPPRRAGVSSFGLGGTNVHLVLEEAPRQSAAASYRPCHLVVWSAHTESAAEAAGTALLQRLRRLADDPESPEQLGDVAYTSQVGRRALRHRRALVCGGDDPAAAAQRLESGALLAHEAAEPPVLAFLLPGLGDHHPGMLAQLYRTEEVMRQEVDRCAEILLPMLGLDLREALFPEELPAPDAEPDLRQMLRRGGGDRELGELARTAVAHPALFVVEYALARQLMAWGLVPEALVGYSLGELVAACLAQVLDLESALRLVAERARLVQELPAGAMLAVPLAEDALVPRLTGEVALAATDGPHLSVVAGPEDAVAALAARLEEDGVACLRLHAGHAFHSPMMDPAADALTRVAATLELKPPRIPYLSNVSGTWITDREATDPAYWARHLTSPVRFWESLGELLEEPRRALLEVGPGESLAALARQHSGFTPRHRAVSAVGRPRPGAELEPLLQALGQLWVGGLPIDWQAFHPGGGRRVPLPTYPFERHRHWIDAQPGAAAMTPRAGSEEWLAGTLESDAGAEARRQPVERWLWHPVWRQAPLRGAPRDPAPEGGESWLIFLDDEGLGQRIAERLGAAGERVTTVTPSDAFGLRSEGAYTLDPGRRQDYAALWRELCRSPDPPRHLLHLWAVGGASDFEGERRRGLGSLLFLAQTLGQTAEVPAPRITVVTTGVADVFGGEVGVPTRGAVPGACRVIGQELSGIVCRPVDLELPTPAQDPDSATRWWDRAAGQVLTEALAPEVQGPTEAIQTAYRGGRRWQLGFDLADDAPPSSKGLGASSGEGWRPAGGRYLITGSGELALAMAEAVAAAQEGRGCRLALAVEEDLPPRESWQELIEERPEAPGTHGRFRRLLELEAKVQELVLVRWREPSTEDTWRLVAETRRRLGGLDGVIHAAGRAPDGLLQLKPAGPLTGFDGLLGRGAQELLEALDRSPAPESGAASKAARSPLDFVVLCSNSAPLVGGLGQLDRCASSTFLAALAEAGAARAWQRGEDTLVTAVEWGPFVWESPEAGSTGLGELEDRRRRDTERFGIRADEAGQVLARILAAGPADLAPRVVVSPRNLLQHMRAAQATTAESLFRELGENHQEGQGESRRQGLSSDLVAPRSDLERSLVQVWEEMFGIQGIGVQDNFFELGGHSLLAIQVVTRMREVTGFDLPMTVLFDAPTVEQLAALVMGREVESLDEEEMTDFAELFEQVEEMDPEEVQRLLSEVQG